MVPEESLLTVLVYRGGALAKAGHNHVIASHVMTGMAWVPGDLTHASFYVHVPVLGFTIDEPQLRALEGQDFATEVPDSAREGTKTNMLSEHMLDGLRYPQMWLLSSRMTDSPDGLVADVDIFIRDQMRTLAVPLQYVLDGDTLQVRGELRLKQTDLGLTPFSLFGGALRVEDEMTVKFFVVARGG